VRGSAHKWLYNNNKGPAKNNSEELLQLKEWPTLKSFATSCADIIVCSCTCFSAGRTNIYIARWNIKIFVAPLPLCSTKDSLFPISAVFL